MNVLRSPCASLVSQTPRLHVAPVHLARGLCGDVPVTQVAGDVLVGTLAGPAEPAAAASHRADHVAAAEHDATRLEQPPLVVSAGVEDHCRRGRILAAEKTPCWRHRPLEPEEELGLPA